MLEKLLDKSEEIQVYYQNIKGLRVCEVKQKINRPYWIALRFEYKTKRGRYALFNFSLGISPSATNIYQNFSAKDNSITFEVRVVFSEVIDTFLEEVLPVFAPNVYINIKQKPVNYPASYLKVENRKYKKQSN